MPSYPVVLLDVGDTLVGAAVSFGDVYARVLTEMEMPLDGALLEQCILETVEEIGQEIPPGIDRYAHFPGGEVEYWLRFSTRVLSKATGSSVGPATAMGALKRLRDAFLDPAAWVVYPDVFPALDALKRDGVRLGVVSNWDSRLGQVLEMLKLSDYFEQIGISHVEGVEKPDPALFHRVLDKMGARGSRALHVGDVPELDLDGARAAGIDGLLVDRRGRLDEGSHAAVPDLSRLPEFARTGLPAELRS